MKCLIGGIILALLSLGCIIYTVYELIVGRYGLLSTDFMGAVIFHPLTAAVALWLLVKSREVRV